MVIDVRDPWPAAAVALGELSDPRVVATLERLERRLYESAAAIVTVTEAFRRDIRAKVSDVEKVEVVPNGTTDAWLEVGDRHEDRAALGMPDDRFVLTFAGNVGLAQGLHSAVEGAELLDDRFQLQIVGSGPRLSDIREQAATLPAGRVAFRGLVEPTLAARYLRASDASLVSLGTAAERRNSVPVKLFDCCAVGRPVILAAAGEAARIAAEAGAALCIPPGDPDALAEAVRRLQGDAKLRERLARNGRRFAGQNRREDGVARFEEILGGVVGRARREDAHA